MTVPRGRGPRALERFGSIMENIKVSFPSQYLRAAPEGIERQQGQATLTLSVDHHVLSRGAWNWEPGTTSRKRHAFLFFWRRGGREWTAPRVGETNAALVSYPVRNISFCLALSGTTLQLQGSEWWYDSLLHPGSPGSGFFPKGPTRVAFEGSTSTPYMQAG